MTEVKPETVRKAEDAVRDVRNWLAVFKTETDYNISEEAYKMIHEKIEDIGAKIGNIACTADGVDASSVQPASDALAEAKQWWAVFVKDNDIAEEAQRVVHENFDKIGDALAAIECK